MGFVDLSLKDWWWTVLEKKRMKDAELVERADGVEEDVDHDLH